MLCRDHVHGTMFDSASHNNAKRPNEQPPGHIKPCGPHRETEEIIRLNNLEVQTAFISLTAVMGKTRAVFGILTDEISSLIVSCRASMSIQDCPKLASASTAEVELRRLIATLIYDAASRWGMVKIRFTPPLCWVLGALYDKKVLEDAANTLDIRHRRWFADFDLYSMQRVPELWDRFSEWRRDIQEAGLQHPLLPGSTIRFEPDSFTRRSGLLRSPYPLFPLPPDTINTIKYERPRRTRNAILDDLLRVSGELSLTITEMKRSGRKCFSQVVFGRVTGCDETFCIKLYDERYFPIPDDYFDEETFQFDPPTRLACLNYSDDLARREEAVYDRLKDLQGWLLPYCYGFHVVCLTVSPSFIFISLES